jgi:hypothetical protein
MEGYPSDAPACRTDKPPSAAAGAPGHCLRGAILARPASAQKRASVLAAPGSVSARSYCRFGVHRSKFEVQRSKQRGTLSARVGWRS